MNQTHYDTIIKGGPTWNEWRADNPDIVPDLMGVCLLRTNLTGANFQGANLTGANFYGADLTGVNLQNAELKGANFQGAKFDDEKLPKTKPREPSIEKV